MFKDPGEKMKSLAVVLFIISAIATVVLAITIGLVRYGDPGLLFFGILIGGLGASFFSALCLYGFGDCIDDISIMRSQIIYMKDDIEEIKSKLDEQ